MSGVVKAAKKHFKRVKKFVKKYWKIIVIAALIIFTAGIATVGVGGFSAAMGAATTAGASTVGAFFSAVGSTMVAGVAAIGGSIGIGGGVTAQTASGAFAMAPVFAGAPAGTALTLGTGAAAQSLGLAAGTGANAAAAAAGSTTAAEAAALAAGKGAATGTTIMAGGFEGAAAAAGGNAAAGGFLSSKWVAPLLSAGAQLGSSYMQARAMNAEDDTPLAVWGRNTEDEGGLGPEAFGYSGEPLWGAGYFARQRSVPLPPPQSPPPPRLMQPTLPETPGGI